MGGKPRVLASELEQREKTGESVWLWLRSRSVGNPWLGGSTWNPRTEKQNQNTSKVITLEPATHKFRLPSLFSRFVSCLMLLIWRRHIASMEGCSFWSPVCSGVTLRTRRPWPHCPWSAAKKKILSLPLFFAGVEGGWECISKFTVSFLEELISWSIM